MQRSNDALTFAWADMLFAKHAISCFPISPVAKRPLIRTSEWWGHHYPVDGLRRFSGCNIAAQTGLLTRLLVIDVDDVGGAKHWFESMPPLPRTWSVRTGGGGLHIWLHIPDHWSADFGRTQIWKGELKHQEVAVIFGRGMAICPPSRFPQARPYRWEKGHSPLDCSLGIAPRWLLQECVKVKEFKPAIPVDGIASTSPSAGGHYDHVPDKLGLLVSWGLKLAGSRPNASGWISCHRPGEEDAVPSASVRPDTGQVWTSTKGTQSFVATAVALGAFPSELEAAEWVRQNYGESQYVIS